MEKDYSLLRPFDLEAAKRGEKIAFIGVELEPREFIAGPDSNGTIIIKDDTGQFQSSVSYPYVMLPITWVEGRPVYKGDVLYNPCFECNVVVTGPMRNDIYISTNRVDVNPSNPNGNSMLSELTWQKPKTKRKGWVNLSTRYTCSNPYDTKEEADFGVNESMRIACIRIEWEE